MDQTQRGAQVLDGVIQTPTILKDLFKTSDCLATSTGPQDTTVTILMQFITCQELTFAGTQLPTRGPVRVSLY